MTTRNTRPRPNGPQRHYLLTTIRNARTEQRVLTQQERAQLDPDDGDVLFDEPKREVHIKHKGCQKSTVYPSGKMPGFGIHEWDLASEAFFAAGDLLPLESASHVNQRIRRIRKLFQDSKDEQWFFITTTSPYGLVINTNRTWRFIETLAE